MALNVPRCSRFQSFRIKDSKISGFPANTTYKVIIHVVRFTVENLLMDCRQKVDNLICNYE
jgi:hypothetical protein